MRPAVTEKTPRRCPKPQGLRASVIRGAPKWGQGKTPYSLSSLLILVVRSDNHVV